MPPSTRYDTTFDLDRIVRESFIAQVAYHRTVPSTNSVALELCRQGQCVSPQLVLASQQTAGRGRGANVWWSAPGSLTFSVLLRPAEFSLPQSMWPRMSLTMGLSVCQAVDELSSDVPGVQAGLKWPNDVLLDGRKVCGVLVEVGPRPSEALVIGIGVNVNNSFAEAPADIQSRAIALSDLAGQPLDMTHVLVAVLRQIEHYLALLAEGSPELATAWQARCALRGKTVEIRSGTRTTTGVCQGIDEEGALVLLSEAGPTRVFGGVVAQVW
jgi:BirA family biotin operon repressor/biotin-[acetyl-CoA-carboxylase] ligase